MDKSCKTCQRLLVDDLGYYCNAEKQWIDKKPPCGETFPKWTDQEEELPGKAATTQSVLALVGVLAGILIMVFLCIAYTAITTLWPK